MKHIVIILLSALIFSSCYEKEQTDQDTGISLSKAMSEAGGEQFDRAVEMRRFSFPEDHGQHPGFRTEWWYFTGNLTSEKGEKFGYQFTIFRTGLTKEKPERESAWNTNQIYMAHFAVTDIDRQKFYYDERFSREGNALAGAQHSPVRIWIENWEMIQQGDALKYELPELTLRAGSAKAKLELTVKADKPFVLQGDSGLSRKSAQEGNASYYYAYTRLGTSGIVEIEGKRYDVKGYSWFDREWSTSALGADQAGWDWFALQLDDSTELMYYQMRKNDGTPDEFSKGSFITETGNKISVSGNDVKLSVADKWTSPGGAVYPSGWKLSIPSLGIELDITPAVKDQLLEVTVRYWEGSVAVTGKRNGKEVRGRGYAELTGY